VDEQTTRGSSVLIAALLVVLMVAPLAVVLLGVGVFVAVSDAQAQSCTGGGAGSTLLGNATTAGVQVADLNPAQMDSAAIIVAVGEQLQVPPRGIVVALAVASQESRFQNYANDGSDPRLRPEQRQVVLSLGYPHDAVGRDHGSVNAFQQQFPGWGTVAELMNPPTAARKFYQALLRVPGWPSMPVTVAAQTVQGSEFPGAYADDETLARQLYTRLAGAGATAGNLAAAPCSSGAPMSCPATGLPGQDGLTPDALRVLRCVQQSFGDHTYGGVGQLSDSPTSDHSVGRAVDVMIAGWDTAAGLADGTAISTWVTERATALGVTYVIWDAQIWAADNPAAGWQPTAPAPGGGPTLAHRDHVHISVHGNAGTDVGGGAVSAAGWSLPLDPGTFTLSSGYGPRPSPTGGTGTFHAGLDFAAPTATPIRAAATGVVTYAGFTSGGFGNLVIIQAAPNILTYYAHQSALAVATGAQVSAGQVIGAVGTTGDSTGAHLHFEVRLDGKTVDPLPYLRQRGLNPGTLSGAA